MIEIAGAMKATLTTEGGIKVDYTPAAVLMFEDEQYLIMRAEQSGVVADDVLLLRIDQDGEGTRLTVVEDQRPFIHAIEDTLGTSKQIH
jgi:hypothetical protein